MTQRRTILERDDVEMRGSCPPRTSVRRSCDHEQRDDRERPAPTDARAVSTRTDRPATGRLLTDARIEGHLEQIGEQISNHDEDRTDDDGGRHEIVVAAGDGIRRGESHARPREHFLDEQRRGGINSPASVIVGERGAQRVSPEKAARSGTPLARCGCSPMEDSKARHAEPCDRHNNRTVSAPAGSTRCMTRSMNAHRS